MQIKFMYNRVGKNFICQAHALNFYFARLKTYRLPKLPPNTHSLFVNRNVYTTGSCNCNNFLLQIWCCFTKIIFKYVRVNTNR